MSSRRSICHILANRSAWVIKVPIKPPEALASRRLVDLRLAVERELDTRERGMLGSHHLKNTS